MSNILPEYDEIHHLLLELGCRRRPGRKVPLLDPNDCPTIIDESPAAVPTDEPVASQVRDINSPSTTKTEQSSSSINTVTQFFGSIDWTGNAPEEVAEPEVIHDYVADQVASSEVKESPENRTLEREKQPSATTTVNSYFSSIDWTGNAPDTPAGEVPGGAQTPETSAEPAEYEESLPSLYGSKVSYFFGSIDWSGKSNTMIGAPQPVEEPDSSSTATMELDPGEEPDAPDLFKASDIFGNFDD